MHQAQDVKQAAVLGSGTMGHGIAQVLALAGVSVRLFDVSTGALEHAQGRIRANVQKGIDRGKVDAAEGAQALERVTTTDDLSKATRGVQVVVEAIPERIELKREVFGSLGEATGPDVLLATNTSSLPITEIAAAARHPERVVGMHFFNPVHIMKLVEVVRADQSSPEAVSSALDLARRLGKEPIDVKDSPGFASSRLGLVIGLEAIRMLESGVASAEDIDKAMTLGYGFPMGPLRLTDLVGLDVRLSIAEYLAREVGSHFEPPALLRQKVERGELGRKSGRGFYEWND